MNDNETRPIPQLPPIEAETPETPTPEQSEAPPMPTPDERLAALETFKAVTEDRFLAIDRKLEKFIPPEIIDATIDAKIAAKLATALSPFEEHFRRNEQIWNEISGKFTDQVMLDGKVDAVQIQIKRLADSSEARVREVIEQNLVEKQKVEASQKQLEILTKAINTMYGRDITDPNAIATGFGVLDIIQDIKRKSDAADEKADNMALVATHFNEAIDLAKNLSVRFSTFEERAKRTDKLRELGIKVFSDPKLLALVFGSGGGSFALIGKLLGIF